MIRALAVTLILLILFGCNKPKVINPYLTEEEKISNEIEDCLKYSWKCKIYKVVEPGKLLRDLMVSSVGSEDRKQKREELNKYIASANKINNAYIIKAVGHNLSSGAIRQFNDIYHKNKKIEEESPLFGNLGCGFNADYCLSFYYKKQRMDFVFCFSCCQYKVYSNGKNSDGTRLFIYVEEELKELIEKSMLGDN